MYKDSITTVREPLGLPWRVPHVPRFYADNGHKAILVDLR